MTFLSNLIPQAQAYGWSPDFLLLELNNTLSLLLTSQNLALLSILQLAYHIYIEDTAFLVSTCTYFCYFLKISFHGRYISYLIVYFDTYFWLISFTVKISCDSK